MDYNISLDSREHARFDPVHSPVAVQVILDKEAAEDKNP